MSIGKIVGLVAAALFLVTALAVGCVAATYLNYANYGAGTEQELDASYKNSQNIISSTTMEVLELTSVSKSYANDFKEVVQASMEGRYGDNGSKAAFQWLQEQNPSLNNELYSQVAMAIRSGRNDFRNAQTRVIDVKRSYQTALNRPWSGFWLGLAGYPKVDLDKYQIVLDNSTRERFSTGEDTPILNQQQGQ